MKKLVLLILIALAPLSGALAQPLTTQPNINSITVSQCISGVPILGSGTGSTNLPCGTVQGNTQKFVTFGAGTTSNGDTAGFDANGNIVDIGTGAGGGTSMADEGTFTQGTTSFTPIGGLYNSSITNLASGQAGSARLSPERLILTAGGLVLSTGTAWNSSTALNTTQTILSGTSGQAAVLVQLDQTTTITGGAITFEGTYDGTNWVALNTSQVVDPTSPINAQISIPYTLQASTNKPFLLVTWGFQQIRMRLSTVINGTGTVTPSISDVPYPTIVQLMATSAFNLTQIAGSSVSTAASGIAKVGITGNTGAALDAAGQNVSSPANELIIGGQFNTTPTTITSGNVSPLQLDASGNLRVINNSAFSAAFPSVGTAIGAKNGSNMVNLTADGSGNLLINCATGCTGSGGTSSSFAAAFPSTGTAIGAKNGTNMVNLTADGSSNLNVNCVVGCSSSGGSSLADEGTFTQGTTSFTVSGGIFNNSITNLTSGQAGAVQLTADRMMFMNLGKVGASAVSTAASGVQKVGIVGNTGVAVDAAVAPGAAPTNMLAIGSVFNTTAPQPTNAQSVGLQVDQAANLRTFPGTALTTLAVWAAATTSGTTQTIYTNSGTVAVLVQLDQGSGISAGAITFDVTYDGTNWVALAADQVLDPTSATLAQISLPYTLVASTNKPFLLLTHGAQGMRVRVSTTTAGGSVTPNYALLGNLASAETVAFSPTAANFNTRSIVFDAAGNIRGANVNASNQLSVSVDGGTGTISSNIVQVGGISVLTGGVNGSLGIGGLAANGASVSGNPLLHGGRAQNAEITAVTNGQAVDAAYDLVGKQIVMPYANKENFLNGSSAAISTATNTSLISAQAAGVKIYLTGFSCANTGSATSLIQFTSGSGGTVIWTTINPAGSGTNGIISPPVPTAAATALFFTTGTASTSQYCSVTAYAGT